MYTNRVCSKSTHLCWVGIRVGKNVMKFEDHHCVGTSSSEEKALTRVMRMKWDCEQQRDIG